MWLKDILLLRRKRLRTSRSIRLLGGKQRGVAGEKQIVNLRELTLMLSGCCCLNGFGCMFWLNVCLFLSKACLRIIEKHARKANEGVNKKKQFCVGRICLEVLEVFLLAVGCFCQIRHLIIDIYKYIVHIRSILLGTNIFPFKGTFEHLSSVTGKSWSLSLHEIICTAGTMRTSKSWMRSMRTWRASTNVWNLPLGLTQ